mgnify:CR=1 FL=1
MGAPLCYTEVYTALKHYRSRGHRTIQRTSWDSLSVNPASSHFALHCSRTNQPTIQQDETRSNPAEEQTAHTAAAKSHWEDTRLHHHRLHHRPSAPPSPPPESTTAINGNHKTDIDHSTTAPQQFSWSVGSAWIGLRARGCRLLTVSCTTNNDDERRRRQRQRRTTNERRRNFPTATHSLTHSQQL